MAWEVFVNNISGTYGPLAIREDFDDRKVFSVHSVEGESGLNLMIDEVEKIAEREGLSIEFMDAYEEDGRYFAMFRELAPGTRKSAMEEEALPEDPMEFFERFITYSEDDNPEDSPGIWIQQEGDQYQIFIVENLDQDEFGELTLTPALSGWQVEYLYEEIVDEGINLIPPDWDAGTVIPHPELLSWLEAKYIEMAPEEVLQAEEEVEKESFLGLQFLPDGQSPHDYQRNLGETGPDSFPKDEHTQNWDPDDEFDRYFKENN